MTVIYNTIILSYATHVSVFGGLFLYDRPTTWHVANARGLLYHFRTSIGGTIEFSQGVINVVYVL
jgi:hypothetical protein